MMRTPIFIGGVPRSGLTLLRAVLNAHPGIACGPDLGLLPSIVRQWSGFAKALGTNVADHYHVPPPEVRNIYAGLVEHLFAPLARSSGKPRVAEKTSANVLCFAELHALFPDSPLIHVVRDGRDVAASLLGRDWRDPSGEPLPYTRDPRYGAKLWGDMVRAGRAAGSRCGDRYVEVYYEDLVYRPEQTLRDLCERIGERWHPNMMTFHARPLRLVGTERDSADALRRPLRAGSIGRWRRELDPQVAAFIQCLLNPVLDEFGYETGVAVRQSA